MTSTLDTLFARHGWTEVLVRRVMYRFPALRGRAKQTAKKSSDSAIVPGLADKVCGYILSLGIRHGDILLVHSSMSSLKKTGMDPKQIIDFLLSLVGPEGTLALPAFPAQDRMERTDGAYDYDPKASVSWTGVIPSLFCAYDGAIHSELPTNPLVAKGAHAEDMMRDNLMALSPNGEHSSMAYCMHHRAKVLFLGVPSHNTNTMMHVCEEIMGEDWPVTHWYEAERYRIHLDTGVIEKTVMVRRLFWVRYIMGHHTSYKLVRQGLLVETDIDGVLVGFMPDAKATTDYFIQEAQRGRINYMPPRKYRKRPGTDAGKEGPHAEENHR